MASICLYDIDFLHNTHFSPPNLELMKTFNYYFTKGNVVNLGLNGENLERYNQVIFFKSNPNTPIPKTLSLTGETKQIYGYGFFRKFYSLKPQIQKVPPIYIPYDLNEDKIKNLSLYKKIKRNSIIRIENEDFSDFKKDSKAIYVSDYNFLDLPNAENFLIQYNKKYQINFFYPLIAKNEEIFRKFFPFIHSNNRRLVVDFEFNRDFFKEFYFENILFSSSPQKSEQNPSVYLQRILKMILWSKHEKRKVLLTKNSFNSIELKEKPLLKLFPYIYKWNNSNSLISCYNYLISEMNVEELEDLTINKKNVRLLLKQNPETFNTQYIDFFEQ